MAKYLKCNRGDYQTGTIAGHNDIGSPYGLPEALVAGAIRDHETGHKGHRVTVVDDRA
jgi:hypothetical protein